MFRIHWFTVLDEEQCNKRFQKRCHYSDMHLCGDVKGILMSWLCERSTVSHRLNSEHPLNNPYDTPLDNPLYNPPKEFRL